MTIFMHTKQKTWSDCELWYKFMNIQLMLFQYGPTKSTSLPVTVLQSVFCMLMIYVLIVLFFLYYRRSINNISFFFLCLLHHFNSGLTDRPSCRCLSCPLDLPPPPTPPLWSIPAPWNPDHHRHCRQQHRSISATLPQTECVMAVWKGTTLVLVTVAIFS